jgi:ADP-ribose pyrophosphatase YjhB (NUDIX family)
VKHIQEISAQNFRESADARNLSMNPIAVPVDTVLLRQGELDEYTKLRQLLEERGIDIFEGALATFFDDDVDTWFGIWVSVDGVANEFQIRRGKGDLSSSLESATLFGWTEWTENSNQALQDAVTKARKYLRNGPSGI